MKRLHWIVLQRLPGPFFGWLGTLVFLLLMQFLIRWLPEIAGKGIPLPVIVELVTYNLAYMVVLAVPMSVLLAALMAFGGLAESQYYAVIKSTGISFGQLVWPALVVSLVVTGGMVYFNNVLLPEANYRAQYLWNDIRSKRPGFELQPGVFYSGLDDYSILVRDRPPGTNRLIDVTIYDYTEGRRRQAVIKAARGRIDPDSTGTQLTLVLEDGEMHRSLPASGRQREPQYERLTFDRHTLRLDLSDFVFERSRPDDRSRRSDRTMRTGTMMQRVDTLLADVEDEKAALRASAARMLRADLFDAAPDTASRPDDVARMPAPALSPGGPPSSRGASSNAVAPASPDTAAVPATRVALQGVPLERQHHIAQSAVQSARSLQSTIRNTKRNVNAKEQRVTRYRVEIYKKFSIAVACLIFMFIGAPLGLSIRRGGLATIGAIALGIFMFYWITLVQGEKLADRGLLPPWVGMWIANIIMLLAGAWLVAYVILDLRATPPLRHRLWRWVRSMLDS
jgi:lipopolysaccharide export system permease protein